MLCAQFLAADADASATAALVSAELRGQAPIQQPRAEQAQEEVAGGSVPVTKAETSPAPVSFAEEPEVAPTPETAVWNVTT